MQAITVEQCTLCGHLIYPGEALELVGAEVHCGDHMTPAKTELPAEILHSLVA